MTKQSYVVVDECLTKTWKEVSVSNARDDSEGGARVNHSSAAYDGQGHGSPVARRAPAFLRSVTLTLVMLTTLAMLAAPAVSSARVAFGIGISVGFAPPPLPVYVQPVCPGPGYIWTPGYWAYDPADGYYWVPGTWVLPPFVDALWTPGYWGWNNGVYVWNVGYWGPVVGFYGGINYGFGYAGFGYEGGYWNRGAFYYNRSVNNVSTTNIRNVYNRTVVNNFAANRASYNGGTGGVRARPTSAQLAAARARRDPPLPAQIQHEQGARANRAQWASVNHGRPAVAATPRPGVFSGHGVVQASRAGGPYHPAPSRTAANRGAGGTPISARPGNRSLNHARPSTSRTQARSAPRSTPTMARTHPSARPPAGGARASNRSTAPVRTTPHSSNLSQSPRQRRSAPQPPGSIRPTAQRRTAPRPQSVIRPTAQRRSTPRPQSVIRPASQRRTAPRPESGPRKHQPPQ